MSHPPSAMQADHGHAVPKRLLSPDVDDKPDPHDSVLISGAGVAGLASAIALSDIGIECTVFDRRSNDELLQGAGINLQPQAVEDLNSLGLSTTMLLDAGNTITKQLYYFPDGRLVCTLDKTGNDGSPGQIAIHRGELLRLLLKVTSSKENVKVVMNHCVRNFDQTSDSISISVEALGDMTINAGQQNKRFSGSMLLGADGINSKIRKQMMSSQDGCNNDDLQYHGITHYRGVADDFPSFLDGQTMILAGGLGVKVVVYPISKRNEKGLQRINWVIAVNEDEEAPPSNHQEHILNLLSFNGFDLGFLDVKELIAKTSIIQAWPMVDLKPLGTWTIGRTALIGDAAHAMLPVGSGGAMAAVIDTLALRDAFLKSGPVSMHQILRLYQQMQYEGATMHQQKCTIQPAERIVQEAMDIVPESSEVPAEYGARVREAMNALHKPSKANTDATDLGVSTSPKKPPSSCNRPVSSSYKYAPVTGAIMLALAVAFVKCQGALAFRHPTNMQHMLKKRSVGKSSQPLLTSKACGELLDKLTKTHGFTHLERVALTCRGNLQDILSAFHLQPVSVSVNYFNLTMITDIGCAASEAADSPIAVYDRSVDMSMLGSVFCQAISKVRVYDAKLLETLSVGQIGIGQLLKANHLCPEFTLHDAGRNAGGGIWRFYSLTCYGMIEFDILEEFSPDIFVAAFSQ